MRTMYRIIPISNGNAIDVRVVEDRSYTFAQGGESGLGEEFSITIEERDIERIVSGLISLQQDIFDHRVGDVIKDLNVAKMVIRNIEAENKVLLGKLHPKKRGGSGAN